MKRPWLCITGVGPLFLGRDRALWLDACARSWIGQHARHYFQHHVSRQNFGVVRIRTVHAFVQLAQHGCAQFPVIVGQWAEEVFGRRGEEQDEQIASYSQFSMLLCSGS